MIHFNLLKLILSILLVLVIREQLALWQLVQEEVEAEDRQDLRDMVLFKAAVVVVVAKCVALQ